MVRDSLEPTPSRSPAEGDLGFSLRLNKPHDTLAGRGETGTSRSPAPHTFLPRAFCLPHGTQSPCHVDEGNHTSRVNTPLNPWFKG